MGSTLVEKLWSRHRVADLGDGTDLLYVDRVLLHERTGSIALKELAEKGRAVRHPGRAFVCMDHIVDTRPGRGDETVMPGGTAFIRETRAAATAAGIHVFDIGHDNQGIVHVVSPEQGIALPGLTLVCPDSHTCTQGGLGALAWGIGSSEAAHALATQTLVVRRPRQMRVRFEGTPGPGVSPKDMILHLIATHGADGGAGHAVEFCGPAVTALPVEGRMTLCNMAVEFAAWTGLCAPDAKTIAWIEGRPHAPKEDAWVAAVADWADLHSDADAVFDREIVIDCADIAPYVTWGTSPQHAVPITGQVPALDEARDATAAAAWQRALSYMGLNPGQPLAGLPIDGAFIGSCTNSRLSDLRAAAEVLRGRKVAPGVRAICVPGSMRVKAAAEAEGLHTIFLDAGFEWRESGCSMCFFAGGEHFGQSERVVTTTNRNFENRQGPGTRSHLASPATVAASAIAGRLADARGHTTPAPTGGV
ncbi:3-isopropylmalate dehydratase large subunit [Nitrospirillum iridis]|uniref:3-isopropylmalate dehydratase n=1 Tax=Nitrospirillum iridis TaxID=765888 RepID=A0A7X0AZN0_9PROT|nr:3-isopropylmalate dehydratase large subunit [Nitrospirillum iridis]MBB6253068.1 3-isopropylmalate/(R)-2-methylmalate dehydratase large subunit [Nitrospirillum iridis]